MVKLSTHVLDTANGRPGRGIDITVRRLGDDGAAQVVATATTNADGRTDGPLLEGDALEPGWHEVDFDVGAYFGLAQEDGFLGTVTVRFCAQPGQSYHVPLLASPYGYSTYRGS